SKAELMYQRALMICEKAFGAENPHPLLAMILDDYAQLLRHTKRVAEAKILEERAQAIQTQYAQKSTTDS
ncbi:MAG TPA: hypothetical protein VIZ18_06835, partial [Ktedonobacteraceae bacterium]